MDILLMQYFELYFCYRPKELMKRTAVKETWI